MSIKGWADASPADIALDLHKRDVLLISWW